MKKYGKRIVSCLLVACMGVGLGLAGCSGRETGTVGSPSETQSETAPESESERFELYTEELFLEQIVSNTIDLHYTLAYPEHYGITEYEVTLGDYSPDDIEEDRAELSAMEEELLGFDREMLTTEQQMTYDIMMDYAQTELSAIDLSLYAEPLNPTSGYQADLPIILAEYTFRTREDIEDYLTLAGQLDELYADVMDFERRKAEAGLFMSDVAADHVIDQCEQFLAAGEENYMIGVFDEKLEEFPGLSEEEKAAYRERNREVVLGDVSDGFALLVDGLRELKGSGVNDRGLCYFEDGKEYYEYLVREETGSDDSVEELERRTQEYIDGCREEIMQALTEHPEVVDRILENNTFPLTDPEEIMQDLTGKLEEFPAPPEAGYRIKSVHRSMEEYLSPAFYLTTPIDDTENNVIYLNERYLGDGMGMELYPTLAHEGYPGHLYQNLITAEAGLPLVRNLFFCTGYSEGWATYAEFYSYGASGMEEALADILMRDQASSLGLYASVDMGIHYDGWDREEVGDYLAGYGIRSEEIAEEIYETIVEDPADYLSYFIGYLEFIRLREKAEETLGDAFDPVGFHRFLLESGPAPFYILEKYMDGWMERQAP